MTHILWRRAQPDQRDFYTLSIFEFGLLCGLSTGGSTGVLSTGGSVVNPWLSARNAWWHNAGLRGFAGGARPALRGAKAWAFAGYISVLEGGLVQRSRNS